MTLGLLDLSIVTDRLIRLLDAWTVASPLRSEHPTHPPYTIIYTGVGPDAARHAAVSSCQVSVYLFHVAAGPSHPFPAGSNTQTMPQPPPQSLSLYYLLSAHSANSFPQEQQAMSIALKCFHEQPIVSTVLPVDKREERFTLTIQPQTVDEIGRLWQSIGSPMRLSAVYRVNVSLEPPLPQGVWAPTEPPPTEPAGPGGTGEEVASLRRQLATMTEAHATKVARMRKEMAKMAAALAHRRR